MKWKIVLGLVVFGEAIAFLGLEIVKKYPLLIIPSLIMASLGAAFALSAVDNGRK